MNNMEGDEWGQNIDKTVEMMGLTVVNREGEVVRVFDYIR